MHLIQSEFSLWTIHFLKTYSGFLCMQNICMLFTLCIQYMYCRNNKSSILVWSSEHSQVIKQKVCENVLSPPVDNSSILLSCHFWLANQIILVSNYLTTSFQSKYLYPSVFEDILYSFFFSLSSGHFLLHWKYSSSYILETFSALLAQGFLNTQASR